LQDGKSHLSENCPPPAISVNLAFFHPPEERI